MDEEADRRTRAWAAVAAARRTLAADWRQAGPLHNAIEHALVEARLSLTDLTAALMAGDPALDYTEAVAEAEGWIERVARVQEHQLIDSVSGIEMEHQREEQRQRRDRDPASLWRSRLGHAVRLHDLSSAAYRLLGGSDEPMQRGRAAVLEVIAEARAAGATDADVDAELAALRAEQCDLDMVLATVAELSAQRETGAASARRRLPCPAWTSVDEIADQRGTTTEVVAPLLEQAEHSQLLERVVPPVGQWPPLTVTLTAAGRDRVPASRETSNVDVPRGPA